MIRNRCACGFFGKGQDIEEVQQDRMGTDPSLGAPVCVFCVCVYLRDTYGPELVPSVCGCVSVHACVSDPSFSVIMTLLWKEVGPRRK